MKNGKICRLPHDLEIVQHGSEPDEQNETNDHIVQHVHNNPLLQLSATVILQQRAFG